MSACLNKDCLGAGRWPSVQTLIRGGPEVDLSTCRMEGKALQHTLRIPPVLRRERRGDMLVSQPTQITSPRFSERPVLHN